MGDVGQEAEKDEQNIWARYVFLSVHESGGECDHSFVVVAGGVPAGGDDRNLHHSIVLYYGEERPPGEGYVSREFFGAYRRSLKNGIPMTIVFLLLGAVLAVDRLYVDQGQSAAAAAFSLGYTLLILVVASMVVYVFPVMSRFTMSNWECFRLSLLMVFRHLPFTVLMLAMLIASICLVVLIPAPMLFILPGACCYGQSFLMERLLKKYMAKPQTEEEADKWYYR